MKTIPPIGFGIWKIANEHCADMVYEAIKAGYRHIDSASDYGNEREAGEGIQRAIDEGLVTRDQLWVTSKLWNTDHAPEHVEPALDKTLQDLGLDYLDLYLVHFPIALQYVDPEQRYPAGWLADPDQPEKGMKVAKVPLHQTWAAMEDLLSTEKVRQIGICNYNSGLLNDLLSYASVQPSHLQIESHPYLTQEKLMRLCQTNDIQVTAFSPLGALSYLELDMAGASEAVIKTDVVTRLAQKYSKTAAQIVLRWGVQRGTAIIPKTSKVERLYENLDVFDFVLSDSEMDEISALNQNRRFNDPGDFCESAFNTFHPIYD